MEDIDFNIGDRIIDKDKNVDYTITNKRYFTWKNRRSWYYQYKCNICRYDCSGGYKGGTKVDETWFSKQQLINKAKCSCCSNVIVSENINSISVTHPYLVEYFVDKDDAKIYSPFSGQKVKMKCPHCGNIKDKLITISSLTRQGFSCPKCSPTISLGERIVYTLLKLIKVNFIKEYQYNDTNHRYDFYIDNTKTIIEVHGVQHYKNIKGNRFRNNENVNDEFKKQFALSKGIVNYIVINAYKSEFEYIKESIINSKELNELYDLSSVDWSVVKQKVFYNNTIKDICDYWNNFDGNYIEMEKQFNLSEATLRKYIKVGIDLDWCKKKERKQMRTNIKSTGYKRKNPLLNKNVDCQNNSIPILYIPLNIYFKNVRLCNENIFKHTGKNIPESTIRYKCKRNQDFKYITKQEFNNAYNKNNICYGTLFDDEIINL